MPNTISYNVLSNQKVANATPWLSDRGGTTQCFTPATPLLVSLKEVYALVSHLIDSLKMHHVTAPSGVNMRYSWAFIFLDTVAVLHLKMSQEHLLVSVEIFGSFVTSAVSFGTVRSKLPLGVLISYLEKFALKTQWWLIANVVDVGWEKGKFY